MKRAYLPILIILTLFLLPFLAAGSARAANLSLEVLPGWEFYPDPLEQGLRMGCAVAGAGRMNSDSYDDILVGAERGGTDKQGWVGMFLGGASGPQSTPAWEVIGEDNGNQFGVALDGVGDVNGDGYNDIIIGAPNYKGVEPSDEAGEGAAYLYYGTEDGLELSPGWKMEGNMPQARFGAAVAGAGDINGDGFNDVIVGMPFYSYDTLTNAGKAFVYLGSADGLSTIDVWNDIGEQGGAQLGLEVNGAGDVNNDGFDDVLVGQPTYDNFADNTYTDAGAVYLYLSDGTSLSAVPDWSYFGDRKNAWLGSSAAGVGDLNGDGCDDIAIGAPGYNVGSLLGAGKAFVFYGCQETDSGLNAEPDWEFSIEQSYAHVGVDVSGGGDTNGDGYDELLVGADDFSDEQANEGTVYAFFGSQSGLSNQPGWQVEGNKNDTEFGFAVDGAGDTNGDGVTDVLVGSPAFRINEIIKGAAFLYFGTEYYHTHLPFILR